MIKKSSLIFDRGVIILKNNKKKQEKLQAFASLS
jgi:hypothetical protein